MTTVEELTGLGHHVVPVPREGEVWEAVKRLLEAGHAVNLSRTLDAGGKLVKVEVSHYLTCFRCAEEKK